MEKARAMFQEMDLQWDLDELDKITAAAGAFFGVFSEFLSSAHPKILWSALKTEI